ncbi:hypothetical protein V8E51_004702 [Hyaloscypha variabilis]
MYELSKNTGSPTPSGTLNEEQPAFLEWGYSPTNTSSTANFDWHVDDLLILKDLQTSNWQSPKENSPRSRGVTPQTPTTINSKEAAYNRRLKQNRKAQRAFRARQRDRVQCLEQQLNMMVGKYEELQQKYFNLSAAHSRLLNQKKELRENEEELCPSWTYGLNHVTDEFWKKYALEVDDVIPTSSWQ